MGAERENFSVRPFESLLVSPDVKAAHDTEP